MVYDFGFIIDASRQASKTGNKFVGLDVDVESEFVTKSDVSNPALKRSFTPAEIKKLIQDNLDALAEYDDTFRGEKLESLYRALDGIQARADESGFERPLTLEEFDDKFQKKECVYGITRDSINKRITIVFRGTENKLAFSSNWMTNITVTKKTVEVPQMLKGKVDKDKLKFHKGFHDYLFNETVDENDEAGMSKYDQICNDLKSLLAKYPDHKVYVTGHSLGAALSSIAAIYLACDTDLPKPISCINFASPRVGGWKVFQAVHHLEKTRMIRVMRSMNDNDTVTVVPSTGYWHLGFQCTAYADGWFRRAGPPEILYLSPEDSLFTRWTKAWNNSFLFSLNLTYDHDTYIRRIEQAKEELEKTSLNALYMDEEIVGFELMGGE